MACTCKGGIGNFGIYSCMEEAMKDAIGVILVPKTANDGSKNTITIATDTPDSIFWIDKFNQSDDSKRWYPITGLEDVAETFEDPATKTYNSGSVAFLQNGAHKFKATLPKVSYTFAGGFESARCFDHGYYIIDSEGKVAGIFSADGLTLDPYPAEKESLYAKPVPAVAGSNPQEIELNFDFKRTIKMEKTAVILASDIPDYDMTEANGLLNVTATITDIVAAGYTATLTLTDFGNYKRTIAVEGWVDTDFRLFNQTTDLVVSIVTSTEGAAGVYAQVMAAQTGADVMDLDSAVTAGKFVKEGYQLPETLFAAV